MTWREIRLKMEADIARVTSENLEKVRKALNGQKRA